MNLKAIEDLFNNKRSVCTALVLTSFGLLVVFGSLQVFGVIKDVGVFTNLFYGNAALYLGKKFSTNAISGATSLEASNNADTGV